MQIEFEFELEDWMAFQKYHFSKSKVAKRNLLIGRLFVPAVGLTFILIDLMQLQYRPSMVIFWIVSTPLWIIFYPILMKKISHKNFRKLITSGDNSNLLCKHFYKFTNEGIEFTIPEIKSEKISWNGIKKFDETEHYFFLYDTAISAYIIPKNKLRGMLPEITTILREHCPFMV